MNEEDFAFTYKHVPANTVMQFQAHLSPAMPNVLAADLGEIACEAGSAARTDVGDLIDRGLILRRLLEEKGFGLVLLPDVRSFKEVR